MRILPLVQRESTKGIAETQTVLQGKRRSIGKNKDERRGMISHIDLNDRTSDDPSPSFVLLHPFGCFWPVFFVIDIGDTRASLGILHSGGR